MTKKISKILKAEFGTPDKPLKLGEAEIPCYVLEDGTRVLTQRGMVKSLGMQMGSAGSGGDRLAGFVGTRSISPFITNDLALLITNPLKFKAPNGSTAYGYEATVLVDVCDAVLRARQAGALNYQQEHVARACEALVRSFAKVGIIALVDETTGYQATRGREALQKFLDKFIQDEAAKWIKTFPDDFFEAIFRMKGWDWTTASQGKKPGVVGHYINDFVYQRLGPKVLDELRKKNPVMPNGRRKAKLWQHLSEDYGNPKLREHLNILIAFAKAAGYNWNNFRRMVERTFTKYGHTLPIEFQEAEGIDE